jgi:hypothetical protein
MKVLLINKLNVLLINKMNVLWMHKSMFCQWGKSD